MVLTMLGFEKVFLTPLTRIMNRRKKITVIKDQNFQILICFEDIIDHDNKRGKALKKNMNRKSIVYLSFLF